MVTKTYFPVKFTEIDLMGIVHHSNYPLWFAVGRNDYLNKAGFPSYKINALGFFLPLSEINCEFKSPAKYGDIIQVKTSLTDISSVKVIFEYTIINYLNKKILATGKTVHVWTDKTIKPLNIKKEYPKIYKQLSQLVEDVPGSKGYRSADIV